MKLRIRGNSIRLRLTQSEVEQVKETGLVEEKTEFPNGQSFVYSLSVGDGLTAEFSERTMKISISESTAKDWADSNEAGIYGTHGNVQIAVEKDFKCLVPRASDEDTDTFPHPKEKTETC